MKAILIDPHSRTVAQVDFHGDYKQIYTLIDADLFTVLELGEGETLFLDDEGLFREGQEFFAIGNYPHPLAGKALILGTNDEGESVATKLHADKVRAAVRWLSPQDAVDLNAHAVRAMHDAAAGLDNVFISAPLLEIDPDTGKARAA
jgi:hypothetical protein